MPNGMGRWSAGGATERNVIERGETKYNDNIVKCKYADMYKELGLAELGFVLSCGRDGMLNGMHLMGVIIGVNVCWLHAGLLLMGLMGANAYIGQSN